MPTVEVVNYVDEKEFDEVYGICYPYDSDPSINVGGFYKGGKIHIRACCPILVLSHEFWHAVQDANGKTLKESEADEVALIVQSQFLTFKDVE